MTVTAAASRNGCTYKGRSQRGFSGEAEAGFENDVWLHDPNLAEQIAKTFRVASVGGEGQNRVSIRGAAVQVDLTTYRRPVCMVEVPGGVFPVDVEGVLLPRDDFSPAEARTYPRLAGVTTVPAGLVGMPWGDLHVVGGAEIAAALVDCWEELRLDHIAVVATGTPEILFELMPRAREHAARKRSHRLGTYFAGCPRTERAKHRREGQRDPQGISRANQWPTMSEPVGAGTCTNWIYARRRRSHSEPRYDAPRKATRRKRGKTSPRRGSDSAHDRLILATATPGLGGGNPQPLTRGRLRQRQFDGLVDHRRLALSRPGLPRAAILRGRRCHVARGVDPDADIPLPHADHGDGDLVTDDNPLAHLPG